MFERFLAISSVKQCAQKHRRTGSFRPGGAVNRLPKKFLQVAQILQNSRREKRAIRCNNIGRTGLWKWLDTVFQGQYLPSLSINYGGHKQAFGNIATGTTVVLDKDENLSWSGLQWHRSCQSNELTPLPITLAVLFLTVKAFSGAFSSNSRLDIREGKTESVRALSKYFGIKFLSSEKH